MYSDRDDTALPVPGFPIRASTGQSLFSGSPWLIAAVHALLRLLVPRHPPYALTILTGDRRSSDALEEHRSSGSVISRRWPTVQFSRSGEGATALAGGRSLKTQQHAGTSSRSRPVQARSTFQDAVRESRRERRNASNSGPCCSGWTLAGPPLAMGAP